MQFNTMPLRYMRTITKPVKAFTTVLLTCIYIYCNAQADSLHTAANCQYMAPAEREMIYELNQLRSNPRSYLQYLQPLLNEAQRRLKEEGKGGKNYSLTISTATENGKEIKTVDTTWHYINEEEVNALTTLIDELKQLAPLSILQPDRGIYTAATKYAIDQQEHDWQLMHTGSDGSMPWDRITKWSPQMSFGNENIAGHSGYPTARDIVLQLLIDSGIPGYGHRENILNPQWTHVACKQDRMDGMEWWLQEFGKHK